MVMMRKARTLATPTFFGVPLEIRERIYRELFKSNLEDHLPRLLYICGCDYYHEGLLQFTPPNSEILLVNRQCRAEARLILMRYIIISYQGNEQLGHTIDGVPRFLRSRLLYLELDTRYLRNIIAVSPTILEQVFPRLEMIEFDISEPHDFAGVTEDLEYDELLKVGMVLYDRLLKRLRGLDEFVHETRIKAFIRLQQAAGKPPLHYVDYCFNCYGPYQRIYLLLLNSQKCLRSFNTEMSRHDARMYLSGKVKRLHLPAQDDLECRGSEHHKFRERTVW